jgi:predicted RNA-binding Zn-ribbon protein involved in translation (DUF1610 family)
MPPMVSGDDGRAMPAEAHKSAAKTCPACGKDAVRRSRAKSKLEQVTKFLFPLAYYRCRECGWRSGRFQVHGKRTKKWFGGIVNSLGVVLLIVLLGAVVALIIMQQRPPD